MSAQWHYHPRDPAHATDSVVSAMAVDPARVLVQASLATAYALFQTGITHLPVVDAREHPVGLLSAQRFGLPVAHHTLPPEVAGTSNPCPSFRVAPTPAIDFRSVVDDVGVTRVGDVMAHDPVLVTSEATLAGVARLLVGGTCDVALVVEDGVLVGMVTIRDLLRLSYRSVLSD